MSEPITRNPPKGSYVMALDIKNKSGDDLKPLGTAFYDGDGDVQQQPQVVKANSTGSGGVLEKVGGSDGLFGLVAYTCPDINKTLVIWTTMPAKWMAHNHTWVGLVQAGTKIDSTLADSCYNGPPSGFSESQITWEYTQAGQDWIMTVEPVVKDNTAYNTSSLITLNKFKKGSQSEPEPEAEA